MARGSNGLQRHRQAVRARRFTPLRRAVRIPVWGDLGLRLSAALFLVSIVVLIHWFDRDGLIDHHDGHVSFLDVVYFTMISITTTGFGDIAPISDKARLVEGTDPRGRPYYWFGLEDAEHTLDHGTDLEAIEDGYVAVTPLHVDLTHHASIGALAESYAA